MVVWIRDLNYYLFLQFYISVVSVVLVLIDKVYQTLERVFIAFPNTSKFIKKTPLRLLSAYLQLHSRCLEMH